MHCAHRIGGGGSTWSAGPAAVQDSAAVARPGRAATQRCLRGFRILGAVETLAPEGFRDAFFRTTAALGVAKMVFLDGATPKV